MIPAASICCVCFCISACLDSVCSYTGPLIRYGKGTLPLKNRVVTADDVLDADNLYNFLVANVPGKNQL
jgi:hypothetical protein